MPHAFHARGVGVEGVPDPTDMLYLLALGVVFNSDSTSSITVLLGTIVEDRSSSSSNYTDFVQIIF